MNIVLLGRMATWCEPELRARFDSPHAISAIPDVSVLEQDWRPIEEAHVIIGWPLTQAMVARARQLKLIQASGAGIDGLDLDALPAHVCVANTFHHEAAIAEYILMAMLILSRNPASYDRRLREGNWQGSCIWGETPVLSELRGKTVLLIGLGHIARETAIRAKAFSMRLTGVTRSPARADAVYDTVVPWDRWEDALPTADFVVPTCPLTPETTSLISTPQLARMRPTAFLINITRGRVVDEEPLYRALREGRIAGAALDVWYQYPTDPAIPRLPSRFPFHELDNVYLSPHNSGWTRPTIMSRIEDIADNLNRLAAGRDLINVVR